MHIFFLLEEWKLQKCTLESEVRWKKSKVNAIWVICATEKLSSGIMNKTWYLFAILSKSCTNKKILPTKQPFK